MAVKILAHNFNNKCILYLFDSTHLSLPLEVKIFIIS